MNIRNILILGLMLVIAGTAITAVSATQDLTISEVHFNVLDGFNPIENDVDTTHMDNDGLDTEDIDGTIVDSKITNEYINNAGDKLECTVGVLNNGKKIESIKPFGYAQKTINGKNGFFKQEMDDGRNQYKFQYIQDGKLVKIEAPNEEAVNKVIG